MRYYDTETGAFVSEDSWLGETTNPLTLNRYTYVLNNPLNYQDPSGNVPIDTITDVGGLLWSVYDYLKNPTAANRNAVLIDAAFVLTPYAPNPHVSKVKKAIKYLKKSKIGKKVLETVNAIGKIGKKAKKKVDSLVKAIKEFAYKKTCAFAKKIKKKYNKVKMRLQNSLVERQVVLKGVHQVLQGVKHHIVEEVISLVVERILGIKRQS